MFMRSGICYATSNKLMSLSDYLNKKFYSGLFIVAICILLIMEKIINHFFKQEKIEAMLDLLRALIGSATLWEPKKSFMRMSFLLVLFPFIIVTSYIQSELTSFITITPYEEINIEKSEDLMDQNIEVFTSNYHRQFFLSTPLNNHIKTWETDYKCYDSLKFNHSKACAHDCTFLRRAKYDRPYIKISPDIYLQKYFAYVFPIDYPIMHRIRNIYSRLHEAGIIKRIGGQYERNGSEKTSTKSFLLLDEISPLFFFLMYGYICAIILFFVEVLSFKLLKCSRRIFLKIDTYITYDQFYWFRLQFRRLLKIWSRRPKI